MGGPAWEISSAGPSPRRLTGVSPGRVRSSQGAGAPARGGPGTSAAAADSCCLPGPGTSARGPAQPNQLNLCKPIAMSEQLKK